MAEGISPTSTAPSLQTQCAAVRGDRLYPSRSNRLFWVLSRLREELQSIAKADVVNVKSGLLIDYGCGNMPYRPVFEEMGYQYRGCDLPGNELADEILPQPYDIPFNAGTVAAVLSNQVLEHVTQPHVYLKESWRVLEPGGLLILSTHGVWRYHPDPVDLWRWTSAGLRSVIEESGFEIIRFNGILGPEATALQLLQDSVLMRVPPIAKRIYTLWMQSRIRRADRRCSTETRNADASVYMVTARKVRNSR